MTDLDRNFLQVAIRESQNSVNTGGFPVGAVLVRDGEVIASGLSDGKKLSDPTSHAETAAIRKLCSKLNTRDLSNYVLYSSMEPCLMCFSAAFWAYIPKIVFAASKMNLSSKHFEGAYDLSEINDTFRKPISLIHGAELENAALNIVKKWEVSQRDIVKP